MPDQLLSNKWCNQNSVVNTLLTMGRIHSVLRIFRDSVDRYGVMKNMLALSRHRV